MTTPAEDNAPETDVQVIDEEENDPDEFGVEKIVGKKVDRTTKTLQYLVKWLNYPEEDNSWEPVDNLNCPDLIAAFEKEDRAKKELSKRKRRSSATGPPEAKRSRSSGLTESAAIAASNARADPLLIAEDDENEVTETSASNRKEIIDTPSPPPPKGFERGLEIETIVGSLVSDDEGKLLFFIKWKGLNEPDLVDVEEVEDKAPRDLCAWYRSRHLEWLADSIRENGS